MRIALKTLAAAGCIGIVSLAPPSSAQELCTQPSFTPPAHSPVLLSQEVGMKAEARALISGSFFRRPEGDGCHCDIAIAATAQLSPSSDFLLVKRGNGDGTFLRAAVVNTDKHPRAVVAGSFTVPGSAKLDSIALVTGLAGVRGRATLYVPRERDGKIEYQRSSQGPWEVAKNVRGGGIVAARFNRDEHLDFAVAGDDEVRILLGDASGGFTIQTIALPSGDVPSLAAGKFAGAGDTSDLAIGIDLRSGGDRRSAVIVARWSDQASAMQAGAPLPVGSPGSNGTLVKAADLSEAGSFRDLIVAYNKPGGALENGVLKLLTRQPNGALGGTAPELPIEGTPRSLALARISTDNIADLAVSTHGDTDNGTIQILQGGRDASGAPFFKPWAKTAAVRPRAVAAIKLPGEASNPNSGRTVLAAANIDTISFYLGGGDGAFSEPPMVVTQVPPEVRLMIASRLLANGSGDASLALDDLVGARKQPSNKQTLSVWLSTGSGSFEEPLPHGVPPPLRLIGANPTVMAAGKLDGDAIADLVVIDTAPGQTRGPAMRTFKGRGDGTFAPLGTTTEVFLPSEEKPIAVAIAPFTGQGEAKPADIAVISIGTITVWINEGEGRFRKGPTTNLNFVPRQVVVTDRLTQPGKYDLVISDEQLQGKQTSPQRQLTDLRRFTTWVNNGDGQFRRGVSILTENRLDHLAVDDVNSDGFDDVITVGDRRIQGQSAFGTFLADKIEANRVKVYLNDQLEGFEEGVEESQPFDTAGCKDVKIKNAFAARFGEGKLALAGFVTRDLRDPAGFLLFASPSLVFSAVGDGQGRFGAATCVNPSLPNALPLIQGDVSKASINRPSTLPEPLAAFETDTALIGQFRNKLHGNQSPELAAIGKLTTVKMDDDWCPGHSFVPPKRARTCEKIDNGAIVRDEDMDGEPDVFIIQFAPNNLCEPGQIPACSAELTADGHCKGAGNCFCAASVAGPKACQTTRRYGPVAISFASCMAQ